MDVPIHRRFDAGMTEQFLQHFGLHPAFDCTRCIGVAQSVHTESPDSCLIAQFVEMGVIGTVLCRFSGTPVDKDQIAHHQLCHAAASTIHVLQSLLQHRRRVSFFPAVPHFTEDAIGCVCQRNGTVAVGRFGRSRPPRFCTVPELQRFVHRQRPFLEVNGISCQADQLAGAQSRFEDQRILVIVVRASGCFQKDTLFFAGEELDVVCRTDRLGKSNTVHGMLGDEIVHLRRFQQSSPW